jgi:hypothetical protein
LRVIFFEDLFSPSLSRGRGFETTFKLQPPDFRAHFANQTPNTPVRAPKPGGSRLNRSFYMPNPSKSGRSMFVFRGSLLSVSFVVPGSGTTINQQPTGFRAHFADRPCLLPIPAIPVGAPKPGGSRLNRSFYMPNPSKSRRSMFVFRGSLSW